MARKKGTSFMPNIACPRFRRISRLSQCRVPSAKGRLVDEIVLRFTHTISMDWMLPGIPPTGKRVEVAFVVVIQFDGDKMVHEHLFWDQASVLVQLGLLEPGELPVVGAEGARSLLDRSIRLNALIDRTNRR